MPEEKHAVESASQSAEVEGKKLTPEEIKIIEEELNKTNLMGPDSFLYKLVMYYQEKQDKKGDRHGR